MNKNNQEIEIKLKIDNAEELFNQALSLNGVELKDQEGLERDVMYDDGKGFFDSFKVLRIRKGPKADLLTYKEKTPESDQDYFLVRTEIEMKIDNAEIADQILKKLGFTPYRIKERIVRKIKIDELVLEFHHLAFLGDYIEIEGDKLQINKLVQKLGLDILKGINVDYTSLFHEFCEKNSLPINTPQSFEEEKRHETGS